MLVRNRGNRKGRKLRPDIPSQPDNVYPEWIGWWDWFGTNNRRGHWKPYHSARALVRELGLENERQYLRWRSGQLKCRIPPPVDMPMHPDRSYPEFTGWNDFLGCTLVVPMPFSEARQFARGLGLKNQQEFRDWSLGRLRRRGLPPRPHNFSTTPHNIYKNEWQGLNDFLGTPKPKNIGRKWRPFEDARRFVQSIGLRNVDEYKKWTRGNFRTDVPFPDDIPAEPPKGYKEEFRGFPDFLGSKPAAKYVEMWPFIKAREFVRNLHLPSSTQYFEWTKGNLPHLPAKPDEVPVVPRVKYREEWRGWNDWLGSGGPRTKTTQTAKSPSYESKQASASHPYEADPTST